MDRHGDANPAIQAADEVQNTPLINLISLSSQTTENAADTLQQRPQSEETAPDWFNQPPNWQASAASMAATPSSPVPYFASRPQPQQQSQQQQQPPNIEQQQPHW